MEQFYLIAFLLSMFLTKYQEDPMEKDSSKTSVTVEDESLDCMYDSYRNRSLRLYKSTFVSLLSHSESLNHLYTVFCKMGFLLMSYKGLFLLITSLILISQTAESIEFDRKNHNIQERLALLHFKESFLEDCSQAADPAVSYPKMKSWRLAGEAEGLNHCTWEGVVCNNSKGHVVELDLSNSCLYGTFPSNSTLFSLTCLQKLSLGNNHFNFSEIPSSIGRLSELRTLNLSYSAFSGQIPVEISTLSKLSVLDLSQTVEDEYHSLKLYDPGLEKLVRNLTSLRQLHLSFVDISSTVPEFLSNLTSLERVSFELSDLYGVFPASFFLLPRLEVVNLRSNEDLEGQLPEFQHNSRLRVLDLYYTAFSGMLPYSIGKLGSLEVLALSNCHFSGPIPLTLGNLTRLTSLQLGRNDFTSLPGTVPNLTLLQTLDLSNINLNYQSLIPWFFRLNLLTDLRLRRTCSTAGKMPLFLANLTQLITLDLSENQLTGLIPHWFGNLSELKYLHLGVNQLQGPISRGISRLHNLRALYLTGNSGLFGNFSMFLRFKQLKVLTLHSLNLTFPSSIGLNSSTKLESLDLSACNLTNIPKILWNLTELHVLSLRANKLEGNIQTDFEIPLHVLPWPHMKLLNLATNKLTGQLPNPTDTMFAYYASGNQLSGTIPERICNARSLYILDLSFNNMTGKIPSCIGHQLSDAMAILNLEGNNFEGEIPQTYRKFCKLKMINLSQNKLEGSIPRSLANCQRLEVLDIGANRVSDTFPSWLGSLPRLQVLILRQNNFSGTISDPGTGFLRLRIIDLSSNFYTGDLPSGYFRNWDGMKAENDDHPAQAKLRYTVRFNITDNYLYPPLEYNYSVTITIKGSTMLYPRLLDVFRLVDFSNNSLTGSIPDSIGDLTGLQALNLSYNNLRGRMPASLSNINDLQSLDLSCNRLSGEIPQELTQLTSLEVFNVSQNRLRGLIPTGRQFNTFDNSSFAGNLELCGVPLSKPCVLENSPPPSVPLTDEDSDQDSDVIDWIIRSLGCASGFAIGFVIGKYFITDKHDRWFMEMFGTESTEKPNRRTRTR